MSGQKLSRFISLAVVCFLICHNAVAAPTAPSTTSGPQINLKELIRQSLKRSPELKKSQAQVILSETETSQARGALMPTLAANASAASNDNPTNNTTNPNSSNTNEVYTVYLEATQPLYSSGVLSALKQRRQEEDIKRLELLNGTQKLILELTQAYYKVAENSRLLAAAKDHVDILKKYANTIARYEKIGRARKTDRLQSSVNLATAEAEVFELEAQVFTEKEILRKIMAIDELPDLQLPGDIARAEYEKINLSTAVQKAMSAHPDVLIAQITQEKVTNEKKVALADDLPQLNLKGQLGYRAPNRPELFEDTAEYKQVSIELKIPLFSGLTSVAKRRGFEQKKVSATRDLEVKKMEIETQLRSKISSLEASIHRLELARQANVNSKAALDLANRDYQQNLISSQDLISVQRARYESEKLFVRTQFHYLTALLETRRLMGIDLENIYAK